MEAEHQHVAGALVMDDGRHQPDAFVKVDLNGVRLLNKMKPK